MGSVVSLPLLRRVASAVMELLYSSNASAIFKRLLRQNLSTGSANQIVFITGCDSGLGFTFALHAHRLGFTVLAGCLQPDGEGSKQLLQLCSERMQVLGLDITNETSVRAAFRAVDDMLVQDPDLGMPTELGSKDITA
jgi:Dehydrogenases with different specificities (related to short-chain alcohol dehydrogenases)